METSDIRHEKNRGHLLFLDTLRERASITAVVKSIRVEFDGVVYHVAVHDNIYFKCQELPQQCVIRQSVDFS